MNNTNNSYYLNHSLGNDSIGENREPVYFYESLIITVVCTFGLITCIINVVVFSRKQFKEKLFFYLKIESIFMGVCFLIYIFTPLSQCKSCLVSKSLARNIFSLIFEIYIMSVNDMSSLMTKIMATINCIVMVDRKAAGFLIVFNKINVYMVLIFEIAFSSLLFLYQIFQRNIIRIENDSFKLVHTEFYNSQANYILDTVSYTIRDGLLVIMLIALNVFMLIIIRRNLSQKQTILLQTNRKSSEKKIKRSQKKLVNMILFDSLVYFLSRSVIFVFMVVARFFQIDNSLIISDIVIIIKELSYGAMFFIYFYFNKRFRTVLVSLKVCCLFRKQSMSV